MNSHLYFPNSLLLWLALRAQYTPTFHDTIIRDRRLLQSQTLRWGCRHPKENESAKGKHTKTQQHPTAIYHRVESHIANSNQLEWSKTLRNWSFALKLQSLNSSWLCCAPMCTPGSDRNSCFWGAIVTSKQWFLSPSAKLPCQLAPQLLSSHFGSSQSQPLGARPTANRMGRVSTEDLQRPNQSNCLKGLTEIDTAKWLQQTLPAARSVKLLFECGFKNGQPTKPRQTESLSTLGSYQKLYQSSQLRSARRWVKDSFEPKPSCHTILKSSPRAFFTFSASFRAWPRGGAAEAPVSAEPLAKV